MAAQFEYDDGTARSAISQFDQLGATLGLLLNTVSAELAGNSPWSHDKIGKAFAEQFDKDREQVVTNTRDVTKAMQSVAPGLTEAADTFVAQDGGLAGS